MCYIVVHFPDIQRKITFARDFIQDSYYAQLQQSCDPAEYLQSIILHAQQPLLTMVSDYTVECICSDYSVNIFVYSDHIYDECGERTIKF